MPHRQSNIDFRAMAWMFWVRDIFSPPARMLEEAGIAPGMHVLDYGCGPGSYTIAAGKIVGPTGRVMGVDLHPLAIKMVAGKASRQELTNIEAIQSDRVPPLESQTIDLVILYDTFHAIAEPHALLADLHRVLKPGHVLSFSDHHMKRDEIISGITAGGLFRLQRQGRKTFAFLRA
jgi:ubiquinone/menaquinone biosynthesis C-methylase UbiE